MASIVALGIIGYLFYFLFIKGNAYAILLFAFGIFGGTAIIKHILPSTTATLATFMTYNISIAAFIATVITILGIGVICGETK
jgi:ABC-type microcin C transport system permease subunit YejE